MADYADLDLIDAPVFVLEPDATGAPVYAAFNAHARAVTGRPITDFLGRTAADVYAAAHGRTALARHREVLERGKTMTYELDLPVQDQIMSVRTTLSPQYDTGGRVARMYGTSHNITAERVALEAKVSFDTLAGEMEQFVALAAHDLRAPMRNVALLADMLREDFQDLGDGKLDLIKMTEDVAQKSMGLISEVLAHAQSSAPQEADTTFNFAALCRDIGDVLDPRGLHQINASGAEVIADRTAMQIALRNVIENAFKHGKRDRIVLTITVGPSAAAGMLEVALRDNGRGFSDAALKFLNGGKFGVESGYGLHGVKRLLMSRGGRITARNAADMDGSVVSFFIPGEWVASTSSLGDAHVLGRLDPLAICTSPH